MTGKTPLKLGLIISAVAGAISSSAWADCKSLLTHIENQRLKRVVDFALQSPGRPVVVGGFPIHFTSTMGLPFAWLTNPAPDAEYFVVQKASQGFGFSAPQAQNFHLLNEPNTSLRSLDFSGSGKFLLATLVVTNPETNERGAVFRLANIKDPKTGELHIIPAKGLAFDDLKETGKNFVVTSRPDSDEFWMTDGSAKIRRIEVNAETETLHHSLSANLERLGVKSATKIQFFPNGTGGYIRAQMNSGDWYLIPFKLQIEEIYDTPKGKRARATSKGKKAPTRKKKAPAPVLLGHRASLMLIPELKYPIGADYVRTAAHPTDPVVVIAYKDRIEAAGFNIETGTLEKVLDEQITFLQPGEEVLGIDFYWKGDVLKSRRSEEPVFVGGVQGALLVGENARARTRLYWLDLKNGSGGASSSEADASKATN